MSRWLLRDDVPRALTDDFARLPRLDSWTDGPESVVGWSDLDGNGHANHVPLLTRALDAVPRGGIRLQRLIAHFRSEAGHHDRLRVRVAPLGDPEQPRYRHDLVRDDETVLLECATTWSAA